MKSLLSGKHKNWLLYTAGILLFILIILFVFVVDYQYLMDNSSRGSIASDINPFLLLFMAVVIAPVFEEVTFRGYLTNKKILQWATVILLLAYIVLSGYNPLSIVLYILFIILFIINVKTNKEVVKDSLIIINSLLFTAIHYKASDFSDINLIAPMLSQLLLALILSWVVINYTIIHAMICHALMNGLIIGSGIIYSLSTESEVHVVKSDKAVIEWSEDANFLSTMQLTYSTDSIIFTGAYGVKFYKNIKALSPDSDCLHKSEFKHPNNKYNIKIYLTDDNADINTEACELLGKAGLIKDKN